MKTIGLIGGMSWESSLAYYQIINEEVKKRLGGLHSAKCILHSVDFAEVERFQREGEWEKAGVILGEVAQSLEKGRADFILLCTNTMHKVIHHIEDAVNIPVLHIADATANEIRGEGLSKVGLLGTTYTMEQDFYRKRLNAHGIDVIVPPSPQRKAINRIIYEELCLGVIQPSSKQQYELVIQELVDQGAEGIVLGCTEIGLLIKQEDIAIPLFDTALIHAGEAVKEALNANERA